MTDNKPLVSRPKDRSLESFKKWILEMVKKLNPDAGDTMTDEKWKEKHKKFWAKADQE
jgi:hypothetical protein